MKKAVKQWFIDAGKLPLKRDGGCVVWDTRFDQDLYKMESVQYGVSKYKMQGIPVYIKETRPNLAHTSLVNAEIMSQAGIMTPPPIILSKKQYGTKKIMVATQDVASLDGLQCISATKLFGQALLDFAPQKNMDKWAIIKDQRIRNFFLQYMTPECLEQLVNVFLATEMVANPDMHLGNFILYKKPNSQLYEGVCPIDLEQSEIALLDQDYGGKVKIEELLGMPYKSYTPLNNQDKMSYTQRMQQVRQLVEQGLLTQSNKETIKAVLSCNAPQIVKNVNKQYKRIKNPRAVDISTKLMRCAQDILEPVL